MAYTQQAGAFFGHLFDKRVAWGTIWTIQRGAATAIWEPLSARDTFPDEALAVELPPDAMARVRAYNHAVHMALPDTLFWYLGVLGTHPQYAGRRWGHAVMNAGLRRAGADQLPAVLETSNPSNVELYRRGGWKVVRALAEPLPVASS